MGPSIITKHGRVIGLELDYAYFYRGIPFAKCERFGYPEPIDFDSFDATKDEIDPYQVDAFLNRNHFYDKEFVSDKAKLFSESPLTLNIITPKTGTKLPVFVFIHGGAFDTGKAGDVPYGNTIEYALRGIILVSINYRVNIFGFYKNLNYGLYDQEAAIKWVYENIEAFGGDKDNITVGGQSAGAMSLVNLMSTKRLDGIIKGAIVMSGGGPLPRIMGPKPHQRSDKFYDKVMKEAGCNSYEELKKASPESIFRAYYKLKEKHAPLCVMQPGIDGVIVKDYLWRQIKKNEDIDVPVLLGVTGQDFLPYFIYLLGLKWGTYNAKKGRSNVYAYFFNQIPPGGDYKAFHALDLWYAFGNMHKSWRNFTEEDIKLKNMMIDYFSNFIKNKNPNGETLPEWSPITKDFKGFRYLKADSEGYIFPRKAKQIHLKVLLKDHGPI